MTFTPSAATTRLLTDKFSGTGNPLVNWSAVWNNAATTFTGIQFDVTDTASAAGSLLMDLRVGGASRFYVGKDSQFRARASNSQEVSWDGVSLRLARNTSTTPSFTFLADYTYQFKIAEPGSINWTATTSDATPDLSLFRDAADTLAQRRGVNAQAFRIYRTFTDASNYERTSIGWTGTQFFINTEGAGTGVARQLYLYAGAGAGIWLGTNGQGRWEIVSGGSIIAGFDNAYDIGATAGNRPRNLFLGSYMQMSEMTAPAAPAANNVAIYAEDNGSGKTRLMARFATGAAQQIAIEP